MCIRNRNKNLFPAEARRHISSAHNQKAKAKTRLVLNMVGKTKHFFMAWKKITIARNEINFELLYRWDGILCVHKALGVFINLI